AYLDSWQYDAAANLLDRRQGETAQAGAGSVVPFNRITSYRGLHYRYDEYGRVVEKRGRNGTQHYRWDAEHRLTEVAVIRGSTVRRYGYVYDAPGRRVEKHELDAEGKPYNRTTFLWDGMRLAQECRLGRSSSLYIYSDQGSHEPLARVDRAAPGEADEVLYYHTDVNGAPEEMTDGRGNIVWEAGYQVWGNLTHEKETRPVQQNLRFQGQYLDRETGLHYNLYRFYDPDIGKFISGDPISIRGGINLYQYAPNPISWIDPLGLTPCGKPDGNINPKDVRYMQSSIKNQTGEYTVLGNAEALLNGTLKPSALPPIKIWKDNLGKIWTLDHRRLAAFKLAGLDSVPFKWASPNEVANQMWKMTTKTDGKSIILKLGDGIKKVLE
ncbi:type IV secretion protein Rhs, partial [Salmonella enterica subsp. enterica serovar Hadar]|nr:RHS repeat-associated core domain-containing protein [Salmonella enterica]EBV7737047.1 type IV secretion protein Rhs [Salmonella enterica subsp. enterica serovar Hadar]EDU1303444.1 type IV secretion protein Rhs [Salmonella enterica subsp. enterica serovar Hadar]EFI5006057.1 type IV secretion protein Rhs [Salmonella enterica]EFS0194627.1 type IV secretion protein Rhs [Salmonella enterica]